MKQAPKNPDSAIPRDPSPRRQAGAAAKAIAVQSPEPRAELAATQARYFDLYDQAPVGYITLGESGLILEANLTAATLLGVARDALFGQPISCFICEEYQDSYGLHCKQLFETGTPQKCELRMLRTDGTPFWAHHTAQVARNARGLSVCRVVLSDISIRKLAEESLRMKHRVFEASITANSIASPNGIITEVNAAFLRIWGYPNKEECVGKPIPVFFHDPDEAAATLAALNSSDHWEGEFTARRKDGSTFMAYALATIVRGDQGEVIGFQSAVMDISGRKQAEAALEKSRNLHAETERIGKVGGWEFDVDTKVSTWTEEVYRIHEVALTYDPTVDKGVSFYTPASRPVIERAVQRAIEHGESFDVDLDIVTAQDHHRSVHVVGQADLLRRKVFGFFQDITARKQVEAALRESEGRYRDLFELAVDGILQGAMDGRITGANAQMQKLAGRSLQQLLGLHVSELFDPAELNAKPLRFDLLNDMRLLVNERNLLRPDGTSLPVEMHSKRMPDGTYQSIYRDITERKQTQEALREFNELLSLFMKHSPIYSYIKTVTATESRVLHASDNFQQMIGIPGAEMAGKTMAELFPAESAAKITTDDWNVVSSGRMVTFEEDFKDRSYESIKFPIVQGKRTLLAGYTIDITEHKQAEQTLREWNQILERRVGERTLELKDSEARFRQLAEATFEGIAISADGILLDGNLRLAEIHGYELAEIIGRPLADLIAPESRDLVAERILEGSDTIYEFIGMRKDGSVFPAEVHGRSGIWLGKPTRISALRDLSASKRAAASLLAQQIELEQAQRLAMVSEISAGIIHQIGQPLCAMGANLMVAIARLGACEMKNCGSLEIINDVAADVARMRQAVSHLRALAHPEQPTRVPIDLNALVADVLRLLRQEAGNRQLRVALETGQPLPLVLADAVQLSQVILNLVRNAFDSCAGCPPERRTLVITTREVTGEGVELSVRDAGTGIGHEIMPRLFSPFFSTKPEGLGIGLRLSRTIVEAHGGHIEGRNNADGIGATFRVILPAKS